MREAFFTAAAAAAAAVSATWSRTRGEDRENTEIADNVTRNKFIFIAGLYN